MEEGRIWGEKEVNRIGVHDESPKESIKKF